MRSVIFAVCTAFLFVLSVSGIADEPTPAKKNNTAPEKSAPKNVQGPVVNGYRFAKLYPLEIQPEQYDDAATAAELLREREKLIVELHSTKRKIVNSDPEASRLQKEIQERLKKLTDLIESLESVKELNRKLAENEVKLRSLPKKGEKKKEIQTAPGSEPVPGKTDKSGNDENKQK